MKLQVLLVLILLISINEADTTRRFGIRDELNKPMDDISVEDLLVDVRVKS